MHLGLEGGTINFAKCECHSGRQTLLTTELTSLNSINSWPCQHFSMGQVYCIQLNVVGYRHISWWLIWYTASHSLPHTWKVVQVSAIAVMLAWKWKKEKIFENRTCDATYHVSIIEIAWSCHLAEIAVIIPIPAHNRVDRLPGIINVTVCPECVTRFCYCSIVRLKDGRKT